MERPYCLRTISLLVYRYITAIMFINIFSISFFLFNENQVNIILKVSLKFQFGVLQISNHISLYFISTTGRTFITNGKTGQTLSDHSMMHKPNASKFMDPPPKAGQHDNVPQQKTNDSARRRRRGLTEPHPKAVPVQTTTPKRVIDPMHPEPIPIKGNPKNGYSVSVSR